MTETAFQETAHDTTLPGSWEWARVEQLGGVVTGNTPSTKEQEYYGGSVPLFKPTDLNAGYWVFKSDTTLTEEGAEKARVLPAKSILVTCIGATIGKTGLSQVEGATNQQINALVPSKEHAVSEYLYFAFISRLLQDQILSNASSTTLPILNKSKFSQLKIPLPPLNEQHRIVEKIEELFTKLDAGVRSLEQARALLKSYRRSVLKAAVEGELSREWREAHKDEIEPASELLERILRERREKFAGRKYKEPAAPNISELPALPDGWEWARAEQLCDFITKGTTPKADKLSKVGHVPFIKVYNLTHSGILDFSVNPTFVDKETHRGFLSRSRVYPNDVLMNIVGPPLGKVSIVPDLHAEWNINQAIAVFRPLPSYDTKFLSYLLLTPQILHWAKRRAKATAGQFNLTLAICRDLPLPVPTLEEQHFIVEEVERHLSVVDKLEATVEENLKQTDSLRQSILKQAFAGELVPQDPDDEPASVLLKRIREERQATKQKADKKSIRSKRKAPACDQAPKLFAE